MFWGGELAARIYGEGSLLGKKYVVRSRVKAAVNPEKLNGTDRALVYNAQVSLLASLHKETIPELSGTQTKLLSNWLAEESENLRSLYTEVLAAVR